MISESLSLYNGGTKPENVGGKWHVPHCAFPIKTLKPSFTFFRCLPLRIELLAIESPLNKESTGDSNEINERIYIANADEIKPELIVLLLLFGYIFFISSLMF